MSTTQLVGIYRLYKLGRKQGGGYDLNHKQQDRDLHPVHHDFAEESNSNSQINGLLYVEDTESTKLYWAKKPYKGVKEFTPFVEVKDESNDIPKMFNDTVDLSKMTKDQLIAFAEDNEYKVTKTKKAENILLELIEQIEVNE